MPAQEEEEEGVKQDMKKVPESNAWQELMDRKLHKLDMDVRRTGRTGLYDLENVLSNVEKGMKCTANQVKMSSTAVSVFKIILSRHFLYYVVVAPYWLTFLQKTEQNFFQKPLLLFDRFNFHNYLCSLLLFFLFLD